MNCINTNMSKSQFDTLFEQVTQDETEALGLPSGGSDDGFGSDDQGFGGEDEGGEDQVTVTLDKATAQALIAALQAVVGEDEGAEDEFGGEDEDEFGSEGGESTEEDEGSAFPESVVSEAPQSGYEDFGVESKAATLQGKGKNKVDGTASHTASPKQEGGQTKGTEQYVKFSPKIKKDMKDVASNLTPSGAGKSAFNRD